MVHLFWSMFQPKQTENEYKVFLTKNLCSEVFRIEYNSYNESMKKDKGVNRQVPTSLPTMSGKKRDGHRHREPGFYSK